MWGYTFKEKDVTIFEFVRREDMAKYCPECGASIAQGIKFCGSCGATIEEKQPVPIKQVQPEPAPPQQSAQTPSQPPPTPPKPIQKPGLLNQRPVKIGLIMIILAVVGLIVSYVAPWLYNISNTTTSIGHEISVGGFFDYGNLLMADVGLIFLLILGVILMILGVTRAKRITPNPMLSIAAIIIGAIAIIPGLWVTIIGMRYISGYISMFHTGNYTLTLYPAAYVMLIFGILFLIFATKIIKRESLALGGGGIYG